MANSIKRWNGTTWVTIYDGDALIADNKLQTISTADKVSLSAVNIAGATEIGEPLQDSDLIVVRDVSTSGNRNSLLSRFATWLFGKVSGDVTISSSGVATIGGEKITTAMIGLQQITSGRILDGTILNADINDSAAIALSKLASGSSAQIIVVNGSGVPAYVTLSGDAAITNAGVLTVANGAISNTKLSTVAGEIGGPWVDWTPTVTGVSNLTLTGRKQVIGKNVTFWAKGVWTASSVITNDANISLTLPETGHSGINIAQFNGYLVDVSITTPIHLGLIIDATTTTVKMSLATTPNIAVKQVDIENAAITWTTNDYFLIAGTYERA